MNSEDRSSSSIRRAFSALAALNFNVLRVSLRGGPGKAKDYLTHAHRLYEGYGLPWMWSGLSWRTDMKVPSMEAKDLFPEIDFTRSPELLHPMPRGLSTHPHELMILAHVVDLLRPARIVEFGTAEGRTTLNLALHAPADGQVVTLNHPPIPGTMEVGFFYWDHPLQSKIKQEYADVGEWDVSPYLASAGVVFCDACDQPEGLAEETIRAFATVKPGGVVFRHDYGSAEGPTKFWNNLSKELPVKHIANTTLLCLRVDTPEIYEKTQKVAKSLAARHSR